MENENDKQVESISDEVWQKICRKHMKNCFGFWKRQGLNIHNAMKKALADMKKLKHNPFKPNGEAINKDVRDAVIEYYRDIYDNLDKKVQNGTYDEDDIRVCDKCGLPVLEGYYLYGKYACDDECCLASYNGKEAEMKEDLSHADEDCSDAYYTEWESIFFDD